MWSITIPGTCPVTSRWPDFRQACIYARHFTSVIGGVKPHISRIKL